MQMSSKFLTESTGEKIVKIGQYLVKICTKNDSLVFLGHPVYTNSVFLLMLSKFSRRLRRGGGIFISGGGGEFPPGDV